MELLSPSTSQSSHLSEFEISDTNLTDNNNSKSQLTTKELWGWWIFEWANSPTSSVSISVFIPILLRTLADEASVEKGTGIPCNTIPLENRTICEVNLMGFPVTPTSYTNYITVISVIIQALFYISIGSLADYGMWRKKLLIVSTIIGSVFSLLIFTAYEPCLYWLEGLCVIIISLAYGVSTVFYNAFLPLLIENHPVVEEFIQNNLGASTCDIHLVKDKVGNDISTRGLALGYASGLILVVLCFVIVFLGGSSIAILQIPIALTGSWWFFFSLITFHYLKARPGPNLPEGENYVLFSWKKVIHTISQCRKLPNTFMFLAAYFMYSDAIGTVVSMAILFGQDDLHLSTTESALMGVLAPLAALIGNYLFLYLQRQLKLSSKSMVIILLLVCSLVPLYGSLSIVSSTVGFYSTAELLVGTCVFGLTLGASQSYSRVLFAELIPQGNESEFYSLYGITDKGSSWLGPLLIGFIKDYTSSMRPGFLLLVVMLFIPIPLLMKVDMVKGKQEAVAYSCVNSTY